MVRGLAALLDLPEGHAGVPGGVREHLPEEGGRHEVGAGAGGQIPSLRQKLHGPAVDLPIAPAGALHGGAALGEGRRIQDDIVKGLLPGGGKLGQILEYIRPDELDLF